MTKYKELARPPLDALRQIKGGDLNGKTDISPQWRYEKLDEIFGQCGIGWKYEIVRLWEYACQDGTVLCFAQINAYTKDGDKWSDPIPGTGGNTLVDMVNVYDSNKNATGAKKAKPNDEGFKMAVTDAIGTAFKQIGLASDIYRGNFDGSKYKNTEQEKPEQKPALDKDKPANFDAEKKALLAAEFEKLLASTDENGVKVYDDAWQKKWRSRLPTEGYTAIIAEIKKDLKGENK